MPDTPPPLSDEQVVIGMLLGRAVNMTGSWMAHEWATIVELPEGDPRNAAVGTFLLGLLNRSGLDVKVSETWAGARMDQLTAEVHAARARG